MKIACSSATFARELRAGTLTQLEWLDLCANELEMDGVAFDAAHVSRFDADYLAQLKKSAVDLGLSVAALVVDASLAGPDGCPSPLDVALALGAPLVVANAPPASGDADAWGSFAEELKTFARAAKSANVTLALRNLPGTLCADGADLRRMAKDIDSAWLRFAFDATGTHAADDDRVRAQSVIAFATIDRLESFGESGDPVTAATLERFARFRGFVVLETRDASVAAGGYHAAVARFSALRAKTLVAGSSALEVR